MKIGKKLSFIIKVFLICAISAGLSWSFNSLRPVVTSQSRQHVEIAEISGPDLLSVLETSDLIFVDARSDTDFAMGHVPGAFNVPSWAIGDELEGLIVDIPKDKMIIVYCDGLSCGKSKIVARKLAENGFENLRVYPDGIDGWMSLGKDLEGN